MLFLISILSFQQVQATDYFVSTTNLVYYPRTKYTLTLINLEIDGGYNLLIGANQNSYDWQWINFTAITTTEKVSFIHFDHQTNLDNTSQELQNLLLEFYFNNTRIDLMWMKVQYNKEVFNYDGVLLLFAGSVGLFVVMLIAWSFTKYIILKLI